MNHANTATSCAAACIWLCFAGSALAQQAQPAADESTDVAESQAQPAPRNTPIQVRAAAGADSLELEATSVTGTRELPKVLYIVPWKKAELGELPAQPFNSVLDEALMPLDRDVFRREVRYYATQRATAPRNRK